MSNYLKTVRVNLPEGIASIDLNFSNGLNFISGENGTGKSKILGYIKDRLANIGLDVETNSGDQIASDRVAFYNPKRSNQKREIQGLLATMNRENRTIQTLRSQMNQSYADQNFVEYPSFADLFVSAVDDVMRSQNNSPTDSVDIVSKDLKLVLSKVMPHISVSANWNTSTGESNLELIKYGRRLTPTQLSVGENEILSLALSVYMLKDAHDLYLIDEPEVHLNWSLEKQLFEYLEWFAGKFDKQLIVVSHSPVVFEDKFSKLTQFLSWDNGRVVSSNSPSEAISNKLASRVAATFVAIDVAYDKTFFVEDRSHALTIEKLGFLDGKDIRVVIAGGRDKVISLYKAFDPKLANSVFMVDGDNGDPDDQMFKGDLFALKKYCIENYFLNPKILAKISKAKEYNTEIRVKRLLVDLTQNYKNKKFTSRYRAHIELSKVDKDRFFELIDTMDGSEFFEGMGLHKSLGYTKFETLMDEYLRYLSTLRQISPEFMEITSHF